MPLEKQSVTLNFSSGIDTFDDPNQLPIGKFVSLQNSIFVKSSTGEIGALKKRNGFQPLGVTVSTISYLATSAYGSLLGLGNGTIQAYSTNGSSWSSQGFYQPLNFSAVSLVKNGFNQSQQDTALSPNGIVCAAYNSGNTGLAFGPYQYGLFDSQTGQSIVAPASLTTIYAAQSASQVTASPKAFSLGSQFAILYGITSSTESSLLVQYIQNVIPFTLGSTTLISGGLLQGNNNCFDGVVCSNTLYCSWVSSSASIGSIISKSISPSLVISSPSTISSSNATYSKVSVTADQTSSSVYTTVSSAMTMAYMATNFSLNNLFTQKVKTSTIGSGYAFAISNLATTATNNNLYSFYELETSPNVNNNFVLSTNRIASLPVTQSGVVGSETVIVTGLGLGSKAFQVNNGIYLFGSYQSLNQSGYFLINSTGNVLSKFAYQNGGGYYGLPFGIGSGSFTYQTSGIAPGGVPSVNVTGSSTVKVSYLFKDLIESSAKTEIFPGVSIFGANTNLNPNQPAFYTQTGIDYGSFTFSSGAISNKETGNTQSLSGGFLWSYDGLQSTENNFFIYPEVPQGTSLSQGGIGTFAATGSISPQLYNYQCIYQWSDNQANIHRSAPSFIAQPELVVGSGSFVTGPTITFPKYPFGYKAGGSNPCALSFFRSSTAQPIAYKLGSYVNNSMVTGSISPLFWVTQSTNDFVTIFDFTNDSLIVGNEILYTIGGTIEDSSAPSFIATAVFDERLWGISAEDGTLWYSKQLVQAEPVEMAGEFILYVPPSQSAQGHSGLPKAIYPIDDKLIVFKQNNLYYINGSGPDNTGANSQYSEPIQIPSTVGCSNPNSIILSPGGLIFQSDNGIWLLERNLQTKFIGKDVEQFNNSTVSSVVQVPGTNEIRFNLNTGEILIYDLFADQWGSFQGVSGLSSSIYNGLHTFVNSSGQVFQETPGAYLDGSTATVMKFTTGWINLAGLQGYARAYYMHILGQFQSPHTYTIGIAYDYNSSIVQTATINPGNTVGSGSSVEQWQVFFQRQQCQSFQLTFNEISSGTAGAGVVISGIDITYGMKKTYPRNISPKNRTG